MRWVPLLAVVAAACGKPSDPSPSPQGSNGGGPAGPTKPIATFPTSQSVCEAFPPTSVDAVTQLPADHAQPGDDKRPRCTYDKQNDPTVPTAVIEIRLSPSLDRIKRTFPGGRALPGFGDDAWYHHSAGAAALHVQKGGLQLMLEVTDASGKTYDEAKELQVVQGLAKLVLAKL